MRCLAKKEMISSTVGPAMTFYSAAPAKTPSTWKPAWMMT
jgi:hypothetical protein